MFCTCAVVLRQRTWSAYYPRTTITIHSSYYTAIYYTAMQHYDWTTSHRRYGKHDTKKDKKATAKDTSKESALSAFSRLDRA